MTADAAPPEGNPEGNAVTLVIGRTWDGEPLPEASRTTMRIAYAGDELVIEVDAPFAGDPPPPGPPGPTDRLWEHEVVELFVVGPDDRYTEIELNPHGHHLVLQLEGIRNIVRAKIPIALDPITHTPPNTPDLSPRWHTTARIPRAILPAAPTRCNAFRVSGIAPARRFEAMVALPGERPDFHQLDRFAPWPL